MKGDGWELLEIRCSGCSTRSQVSLCDGGLTGAVAVRAPAAGLRPRGVAWEAVVKTDTLIPGGNYQLCISSASSPSPQAWVATQLSIFVSGSVSARPSATPRVSGAALLITCTRCSTSTQVLLAASCGPSVAASSLAASTSPGPSQEEYRTSPAFLLQAPGASSGTWSVSLDLRPLRAGLMARLCIDYDGPGSLQLVDSGAAVYVAGVTAVGRAVVWRSAAEMLQLTCEDGCLAGVSEIFLATTCAGPAMGTTVGIGIARTGAARLAGVYATFEVVLDTSCLSLGVDYRLCSDLDGAGGLLAGDTGLLVHVSAIRGRTSDAVNTAIRHAPSQTLLLECWEGCSAGTHVTLAGSCAPGATGPTGAGATGAGVGTGAGLSPDGSRGAWRITVDASALAPGRYRLCADLDGFGVLFSSGDTGVEVDILA